MLSLIWFNRKGCEYCEGETSPISFPIKYIFADGKEKRTYYGFTINKDERKIAFFEADEKGNNKEFLFKRQIDYCPFCGKKI